MSSSRADLFEARDAHQAALFAAGDWASGIDLTQAGPHGLDWLRFRVAHQFFFPQQAHGACEQQYRDNVRHRQMQKHEFSAIRSLEDAGLLNLVAGRPPVGPAIYCAFHLGAWAIQPVLLIRRGIPMTIVAGPGMAKEHGGTMVQMTRLAQQHGWCSADLNVVSSDAKGAAVQMIRGLRDGRSLYICVDGQRGYGGQLGADVEDRHVVALDFAGRRIHVRMGAAFLAHKLGLPLVPMVSWREADGRVSVELGEAIEPAGARDPFANQALQSLWRFFERRAQRHASQWEMGWYNYRTRVPAGAPALDALHSHIRFNEARFHLYEPSRGLVLDERSDEIKQVPPVYAQLMAKLRQMRDGVPGPWLRAQFKDPATLDQLLAAELLVAQ